MAATWVLRFPQVDEPEKPVLVHITQKQGTVLDLDLLATDGENAYKGKVRERSLSKLQYKNYEGTNDEWMALLHHALVSKRTSNAPEDQIASLEVDCVISGKHSNQKLSITLRSRIEDITHKLGSIDLSSYLDTENIDIFAWACQLAEQRDKLEEDAISASKGSEATKDKIATLEAQLENLVKAKDEHEEQLLTKFAALLNTKKLKIRDYQRVLSTANVDKKKLEEIQSKLAGLEKDRSSYKRKRISFKAQNESDDDESDAFEAMDVDKEPEDDEVDGGGSGRETPPRSDSPETETASEDEDRSAAATKTQPNTTKAKSSKVHKQSPPPPPRALPFQKKGQKAEVAKNAKPAPPEEMDEDEETASEDDEL